MSKLQITTTLNNTVILEDDHKRIELVVSGHARQVAFELRLQAIKNNWQTVQAALRIKHRQVIGTRRCDFAPARI
jgi:hypothetical protein